MAMDMSVVDNPFDPDFQKSIVGRKKKALVYHGTSTKWFWEIVNNGFTFDKSRMNWSKVTPGVFFSFDPGRTNMYSHAAVTKHGGDHLMFVAEVPFSILQVDPDDKETFDATTRLQAFSPVPIPAKYITGVIYPVSNFDLSNSIPPETPMKQFIAKVNKGKIPSISPEANQPKRRFTTASMDDVEHAVVNMLQDMIQYTDLAHWVMEGSYKFNQIVLQALHSMKWSEYAGWRGRQWLKFLERVLGEPVEDNEDVEREYNRPTYELIRKFQDVQGHRKFRLGKNH